MSAPDRDDISVRDRRPDDLESIVDLALESLTWHAATFSQIRPAPARSTLLEDFRELGPSGSTCFRVAEDGRGVRGFLTASLRPPTTGGIELVHQPSVYVSDVVVARTARRRGVARALLTDLERWAEQHGCRTIHLSVHAGNEPARLLYEGLDYRPMWTTFRKEIS